MPPILDVAIGIVFVFLLFSLVVSTLNEVILSFFDQRAKFLQMGLKELLGNENRVAQLCNHGLISAFSRTDKGNKPSYIPSGAFVTALLDLILRDWGQSNAANAQAGANAAPNPLPAIPDLSAGDISQRLKDCIAALPNDGLGQSMRSLLTVAGQDIGAFKLALEGWFNDAMDRTAGWYKYFTQKWMIVFGLVLAAAGNVDTIHIVRMLSMNPDLQKAIVSQAVAYSKAEQTAGATAMATLNAAGAASATPSAAAEALPSTPSASASPVASGSDPAGASQYNAVAAKDPENALNDFQDALTRLGGTGIPVGWDSAQAQYFVSYGGWNCLLVLAGWVLTALAASLGAPFWFDVLGRIINIRNAGKAPEENDPTAPPDASLNNTPGTPAQP